MKEKIRYGGRNFYADGNWETTVDGKDKAVVNVIMGSPKNTLITVRDGDRIFFGISRCNKKDIFSKKRGKEIARLRVEAAQKEFASKSNHDGQSLLYGVTTDIENLLEFFHNELENCINYAEEDSDIFFTNNI